MKVNPIRSISTLIALITLVAFLLPATPAAAGSARRKLQGPDPMPFLFGVVSDTGAHYDELWNLGLRATTFEFQWKRYEPSEGVYDSAYIDHMRAKLAQLKAQGWYVQMVPGFHYAPDWVFQKYPNLYYLNQWGEKYNPDPLSKGDFRVINAPFNPQARQLIAGYLQRIFQDFPQNDPATRFDAVRVGGGVQGELRYPPSEYNGRSNNFWAFDASAQDPSISGIPASVVGWRPGIDPNPGTTGKGQLLVNPGFETTHAWYQPFAWTPDGELLAEQVNDAAHSGSLSLRVTLETAHRVHQFVRIEPGKTYELSGWVKSDDGVGHARLFAVPYDASFQPLSAAFLKLESAAKTWTRLSGSLATPTAARFLKIELDGDRAGSFSFDDLSLRLQGSTAAGDREVSVPTAFLDWYIQKMSEYQAWQIAELRKYYSGELHLVYAGKGLQTRQVTAALVNDLRGDGWSEASSALYAAADYSRHLQDLTGSQGLAVYLTGIEDPPAAQVNDTSYNPGEWSAAHWLASLARPRGLPLWAENSGKDTPEELVLAVQRLEINGYRGLLWATESELFAGAGYATAQDYANQITRIANTRRVFLPIALRVIHP